MAGSCQVAAEACLWFEVRWVFYVVDTVVHKNP